MTAGRVDRGERKQPGPKRSVVPYNVGMSKTELFVANVNAILEAENLSISEVARRAEVSRAELSRVLAGEQGCTIDRAEKIAVAVGLPLEDLLANQVILAK